jgi:hypothetical protein
MSSLLDAFTTIYMACGVLTCCVGMKVCSLHIYIVYVRQCVFKRRLCMYVNNVGVNASIQFATALRFETSG